MINLIQERNGDVDDGDDKDELMEMKVMMMLECLPRLLCGQPMLIR